MESETVPHHTVYSQPVSPLAALAALMLGGLGNLVAAIDVRAINEWFLVINTGLFGLGLTLITLYTRWSKARREELAAYEAQHRESLAARLKESEEDRADLRTQIEDMRELIRHVRDKNQ
jgi:type VI protein secretion system component VasK